MEFTTTYVSMCTNGCLQLNIKIFFPCSRKNLICLLKTINMADDPKETCKILLNNLYQYGEQLHKDGQMSKTYKLSNNIEFIENYMMQRSW